MLIESIPKHKGFKGMILKGRAPGIGRWGGRKSRQRRKEIYAVTKGRPGMAAASSTHGIRSGKSTSSSAAPQENFDYEPQPRTRVFEDIKYIGEDDSPVMPQRDVNKPLKGILKKRGGNNGAG